MTFARYIVVQVLSYGLDLGSFLVALVLFELGPIGANLLGKILAGIFAFFTHRHFTFGIERDSSGVRQIVLFAALLMLNLPLSSAILSVMLLGLSPSLLAKLAADVIGVFINYWLSKKYVFVSDRDQNSVRI